MLKISCLFIRLGCTMFQEPGGVSDKRCLPEANAHIDFWFRNCFLVCEQDCIHLFELCVYMYVYIVK